MKIIGRLWYLFLQQLARFFLFITGWKVDGQIDRSCRKMVMLAAPHTSNWDFFFMRCAFYVLDIPLRYTIKKEFLKIPILGAMMKGFGAIPIDRKASKDEPKKKRNMIHYMANLMKESEELILLITPEGTRKYNKKWKTGFYHIARLSKVPIVLGYLDYKTKTAGVGPSFSISDDLDKDLEKIMTFYKTKTAKFPDQFIRD